MPTNTYHYSAAWCGAGKTEYACEKMASLPARTIYVVDRVEEFEKRRERIFHYADQALTNPVVRSLSSKSQSSTPGVSVTAEFPNQIARLSSFPHAILMITHEAMKLVDHTVVLNKGWQIIVDEDPKVWSHASFDIYASKPFWSATYNLSPFLPGYSVITTKADAPTFGEVFADDITRPLSAMHGRLGRGQTVVNVETWDDLEERKVVSYFSVWDATELTVYDRVTVLANSFDTLVTFRLIQSLYPQIALVPFPITRQTTSLPRDVTINYVADDHRAGTHFFSTDAGKLAVSEWASFVRDTVSEAHHYWCTNKARSLSLPGERISPKIAGSNLYRRLTECSVLYTAKATQAENEVFSALTNGLIDPETVMRDREYEDLVQIVFRSSLRMPEDTRPVTLNVYDREQAEFLRDYMASAGFPYRVSLNFIDRGIVYQRGKSGPKLAEGRTTPLTTAERTARHRAKKKAGDA